MIIPGARGGLPRVLGFVATSQRRRIFVNSGRVGSLDGDGARLRSWDVDLNPFKPKAGEILIGRDIIDKKIGDETVSDVALRAGLPIYGLEPKRADLEALFFELTEGTNRNEAALFRLMRSPLMPITPRAITSMFNEIAAEQPDLQLPTEEQLGSAYARHRGSATRPTACERSWDAHGVGSRFSACALALVATYKARIAEKVGRSNKAR